MFLSYQSLSLEFDARTGELELHIAGPDGLERSFVSGRITLKDAHGKDVAFSAFSGVKEEKAPFPVRRISVTHQCLIKFYHTENRAETILCFTISNDSITVQCNSDSSLSAAFEGRIFWGREPFAARTRAGNGRGLAPVSGPAFDLSDNALFDRDKDMLLEFVDRARWRIDYDYGNSVFIFSVPLRTNAELKIHHDWLTQQYQLPFVAIDKSHEFKTPPVGWMTWYAVKFDACENVVLENTRRLRELFAKYNDRLVIWVDWEWCHRDFSGNTDTDVFSPRRDAYPHGLDGLAQRISDLGLIPALWCAPCQDERQNRLMMQHPDWVLGQWNGLWYVDASEMEVAEKYIPAVFKQFQAWGYQAFKWDFLYQYRDAAEALHSRAHHKAISNLTAFRRLTAAARKTVGPSTFMLFCAIGSDHDLAYALGNFNAMRIGGDVFHWHEFVTNVCQRLLRYYPYHNTAFYADGDNLILRDEFNTESQAKSRISLYCLTGLPLTIGDRLDVLDDYRIDLLRRAMPVVNFTPRNLRPQKFHQGCFVVQCAFSRHFGKWWVAGLFNFTTRSARTELRFTEDLGLEAGTYAIYDYWNEKFLGVCSERIVFSTQANDTTLLRITPVGDKPEVISSSRHITQGGYELEEVIREPGKLSGTVQCVGAVPLRLCIWVPPGMKFAGATAPVPFQVEINESCVNLTLTAPENTSVPWKLTFM